MLNDHLDPRSKFLSHRSFAVAGASRDRQKYGNKVLRSLRQSGRTTYAINPNASNIEAQPAYPSLEALPEKVEALSIITPPHITRTIISQAISAGIKSIWIQPGAEDEEAAKEARLAGLSIIDDGSCLLVSLAMEHQ